jgi:hypothetical protein
LRAAAAAERAAAPTVEINASAGRDVNISGVSLVQRFGASASKFSGKIQEFIEYYLVSEEGVVPFGGRDRELARLDLWLNDHRAAARLLLTAPAGRGKSALLVQWIERLGARGAIERLDAKWSLVFVPISIRFGTNLPAVFYEAIAARLAEILGQKIEPAHTDPETYYQDKCRKFLADAVAQNMPILLVIDGIDEALGSHFEVGWFPRRPGASLRLLVSARLFVGDRDASGWQDRLMWSSDTHVTTLDLGVLDPAAIENLLNNTGELQATNSSCREVAETLSDLTGGEPLLLRLLVEDLSKPESDVERLTVDGLKHIGRGLRGYFNEWMRRQRNLWQLEEGPKFDEDELKAHLAVLACAYGPLAGDELAELVQLAYGVPPRFSIKDTLYPLRRFIVGTPRRDSDGDSGGYVLGHPRFGSFLREEYTPSHIKKAEQAFATWGRDMLLRLNHGSLPATEASPYALQYVGQHLDDVHAPAADLMQLVEEGWLRGWEEFEDGGYSGFSRDVRRAADAVLRSPDTLSKAKLFRCKLVFSSIFNQGEGIPLKLMVAGYTAGMLRLSQVRDWLKYRKDKAARAKTLAVLAGLALESERSRLVAEVLLILHRIVDDEEEVSEADQYEEGGSSIASVLETLWPYLTQTQVDETLDKTLRLGEPYWYLEESAQILSVVASKLDGVKLVERTTAALDAIEQSGSEAAEALVCLAPTLDGAELSKAIAIAESYPADVGAVVLSAFVSRLPDAQQNLRIPRLLAAAENATGSFRSDILVQLAPLLKGEELDEAIRLAHAMPDDTEKLYVLAALASQLSGGSKDDALAKALSLVGKIKRGSRIDIQRLSLLAPFLRGPGMEQALKAARAIDDHVLRVQCLAALISSLDEPLRSAVIDEAFQFAEAASGEGMGALAPYLTGARLKRALELARAIRDNGARVKALHALAQAAPTAKQSELFDQTVLLARSIKSDEGRVWALLEIKELLSEREREEVLKQAMGSAIAIPQPFYRQNALREVVRHLSGLLPQTYSEEILREAMQIEAEEERAEALAELLPHLFPACRAIALDEVLRISSPTKQPSVVAAVSQEIAAALPTDQSTRIFNDIRRAAARMKSVNNHAVILSRLIPALSKGQQPKVVAKALWSARRFAWLPGSMSSIARLTRYLSTEQRLSLLQEALVACAKEKERGDRDDALSILVELLPDEAQPAALDLFIDRANPVYRGGLLKYTAAFVPVVARLEGQASLAEIRRSILETARWFP